ncbi:MAG: hypothetical protein IPI63_07310 [Methanothrix sp.]|jgi:hypothetical protein|uniref:hypothetical protein n=1 Tax=Methanothrix sp. TaxID=90426 RepID=UPI0025E5B9E4|nr:hypothetical protein [Methanothrix sp.]MBK7386529.1 hypothetical protein [Methanothrix sp.]
MSLPGKEDSLNFSQLMIIGGFIDSENEHLHQVTSTYLYVDGCITLVAGNNMACALNQNDKGAYNGS